MSAPNQPVSAEEGAAILRLHHVEGWPVGTIATQLHRHHDSVERVLAHGGIPITKQVQRGRLVDPYVPFIEATLGKYPRLRASRLWAIVVARGYTGSAARLLLHFDGEHLLEPGLVADLVGTGEKAEEPEAFERVGEVVSRCHRAGIHISATAAGTTLADLEVVRASA